jgi:hypothetical protein
MQKRRRTPPIEFIPFFVAQNRTNKKIVSARQKNAKNRHFLSERFCHRFFAISLAKAFKKISFWCRNF